MKKLLDVNMDTVSELQEMSIQTGTDLYEKLVGIFIAETPVRLEAIYKAWANKNYEELGASAHGLKSGAAYLGADKLSFLAAEVENNCSKSNFTFDFEATISQMNDTFITAKEILSSSLDQLAS